MEYYKYRLFPETRSSDLRVCAAEIVVAYLHVICLFPNHRIAVDDLLAYGNGRIVGMEVLFRILLRITVEQPATLLQQGSRVHMARGEECSF